MKANRMIFHLLGVLVLTIILSSPVNSTTVNDADALQGYNTGKIVFDINIQDPKALGLYLSVIKQTYNDLIKQEITPNIILAFRGVAVTLIQKTDENGNEESKHIDNQIVELQDLGVKMEVCSIATGLFQVPSERIPGGIKTVGNTFISLMGYQHQGFAIIPIM